MNILVELTPRQVELIGELIETVYEDVDRARNEAEFAINRGYIPQDSSLEEYEAVVYNATESLTSMDDLKTLLGLGDDFTAKATGEEPEIEIQ